MSRPSPRRARPRPRARLRRRRLLRLVVCAGVVGVGFLYVQPLRAYLDTRDTVAVRSAEVERLRARNRALERQLAVRTSDAALLREARRLGYVAPGERLFIVKGIGEWRRAHRTGTVAEDG